CSGVNGQEPANRRPRPCETLVRGEKRSTVDATVSIFRAVSRLRALAEREASMDPKERRRQIMDEANALYKAGRSADALGMLMECFGLFTDEEQTGEEYAEFMVKIGSAAAESGQLKVAERCFNAARLIFFSKGDDANAALVNFNLGN